MEKKKEQRSNKVGWSGVGWLALNGGIAQPVRVPMVGDMKKLDREIYDNLAKSLGRVGLTVARCEAQARRADRHTR